MTEQTNKEFEAYYAKRLSWYPLTKALNHPTKPDGEYLYDSTKAHWETWAECQKVNDARINTLNDAINEDNISSAHITALQSENTTLRSQVESLLAVVAAKDEALKAAQAALDTYDYTDTKDVSDKYIKAERLCAEAIAFNPGDVELVEVGKVDRDGNGHDIVMWTDFIARVGDKLYLLKKKEGM